MISVLQSDIDHALMFTSLLTFLGLLHELIEWSGPRCRRFGASLISIVLLMLSYKNGICEMNERSSYDILPQGREIIVVLSLAAAILTLIGFAIGFCHDYRADACRLEARVDTKTTLKCIVGSVCMGLRHTWLWISELQTGECLLCLMTPYLLVRAGTNREVFTLRIVKCSRKCILMM